MTHPLDGAQFKIIWAKKHLKELKGHIGRYFEKTPHTFPLQYQGDVVIVNSPRLYDAPHGDIGGHIGDCLCAMMASLDYVMWELVSKYIGRPLVPKHLGGNDAPGFPLYWNKTKWDNFNFAANKGTHYKFPATVVDKITAVQPYNRGYEPLGLLHILVNQDKHRLPLLVEGHVKTEDFSISHGGQAATIRESTATSVAINTPPPMMPSGRQPQVEVKAEVLAKFVAFGDPLMPRKAVEITLAEILKCVEGVVNDFKVFF